MCRIAVFSMGILKNEYNYILNLLEWLEERQGGDGNGLSWWNNKKQCLCRMFGEKIEVESILKKLIELNLKNEIMIMFHTRLASAGYVSDENCQPLRIDKTSSLCHNGTWGGYHPFKTYFYMTGKYSLKEYIGKSDTSVLVDIIKERGEDFLNSLLSGVILLQKENEITLYKHNGSFEYIDHSGEIVYASAFDYKESGIMEFSDASIISLGRKDFVVKSGKPPAKKSRALGSDFWRGSGGKYIGSHGTFTPVSPAWGGGQSI